MNVLYVCADRGIPLLGHKGASVHVRSLTSAMQALGHRVTVVARRWDDGNDPPTVERLERLAPDRAEASEQLVSLIDEDMPDAVIERYSLQSGASREACTARGLALTLEVNAPLAQEARRFRGLDDEGAQEHEHATLRSADRIHVVSTSLLRYARTVAPGVPVVHIPNGADVSRFAAASPARLAGTAGRVLVGFTGSMKPWHGVEQLLEAFARVHSKHPRALLGFVGTGPLHERLVERTRDLGLGASVLFAGARSHAAVPSLVARFDIAVAPYQPLEDFYFQPLKVVEYLAAGKPVIYSDQGMLRELVGGAGLGFQPGSVAELSRRLSELLGDESRRLALGAKARARARAFDWRLIAERVLRFATAPSSEPSGAVLVPSETGGRP